MRVHSRMPIPTNCDVCGASGVVYRESNSTYARTNYKTFGFYVCTFNKCRALVTCRPGSIFPVGLMALKDVRKLRIEAHVAFDPLWQCHTARWSRDESYEWVAVVLDVPLESCNISKLSKDKLLELIELSHAEYAKQVAVHQRRNKKKAKRHFKQLGENREIEIKHKLIRISGCSQHKSDGKTLDFKRRLRKGIE